MKFRQLEAFRNIMLRGTTAAAAMEMHITQPAVSRLISDLEHSLGFSLFERRKGRLYPTQEAGDFFRSVEESFLGLEKLESVAEQIRNQTPKALRIAATSAIASSLLPLVLAEHRRYFPQEKIIIHTNSMAELVMKLQTNSIDLAVGLQLPPLSGLEQECIGQARYVFAAKQGHPLLQKTLITAPDLAGESVLTVLDSNATYWQKLTQMLSDVEPQLHRHLYIDTSHTAYSMIAQGLMIGVLEPFAARAWRNNGIETRPFEPAIHYPYGLAYPTNTRPHPSLYRFTETLKQIAQTMPEFALSPYPE